MLVIGYHGCDQATCDALVAGSTQLRPSCNPYDWLGMAFTSSKQTGAAH